MTLRSVPVLQSFSPSRESLVGVSVENVLRVGLHCPFMTITHAPPLPSPPPPDAAIVFTEAVLELSEIFPAVSLAFTV